jgi:hypothetical protein
MRFFIRAIPLFFTFLLFPILAHSLTEIKEFDAITQPDCVVSVLNQTVPVIPDGEIEINNVPVDGSPLTARLNCTNGAIRFGGKTALINPPLDGIVDFGILEVTGLPPIIDFLSLTSSKLSLTSLGDTAQFTVTGTYDDGTTADVTGEPDTVYTTSNPNIATVSSSGLVTAVSSGTVVLSASKDGVLSTLLMMVSTGTAGDSDGDEIPDDYETANGLNPNDPFDADLDPDGDGLTNLQEFQTGTDPNVADTDGDGISDGAEVAGTSGFVTNPLLADTDGDGIRDLLEIQTGSDPTDAGSFNLAQALTSIDVTPSNFILAYNTILNQDATRQLTVTGNLSDGTTINLTSTNKGTNYTSSDLLICNFGATDGEVFAGQDGLCTLTVSNSGFSDTASVTVETFSPVPLSFVDLPGIPYNLDVRDNYVYVADGVGGLQVVDVSDRSFPQIVSSVNTPATNVQVVGDMAYLSGGSGIGLYIVDISDPLNPQLLGSVDTPGLAWDVAVSGNRAVIADEGPGIHLVDISDPATPVLVSTLDTPGLARGVDVVGDLAIVADRTAGIQIVDISNMQSPQIVGSVDTPGDAFEVMADGNIVYVADYTGSLQIVDISDPANPVIVGSVAQTAGGVLLDVAQWEGLLFGADGGFFTNLLVTVFDIGNPSNPLSRGSIDFSPLGNNNGLGVEVDSAYVYLTASQGSNNRLYIGQYVQVEDNGAIAPSVSISSPQTGDSFIEGTTIAMSVLAADDVRVVAVEFFVDGQAVFIDQAPPYEFTVSVPEGVGSLTLGASAIDLAGNVGLATDVIVNVIPDPNTTVTGRVLDTDGFPVSGITVTTNLGQTGFTLTDGSFELLDVPTIEGLIKVTATQTTSNGEVLQATSGPVDPIPGGAVSVGDLVLEIVLVSFEFEGTDLFPDFTQVDFTGTVDSQGGSIGNGGAVSEDGVLKLSSSVSPSFPGGTHAKIRSSQAILEGDFDVIIDFDLIAFPNVTASGQEAYMTAGFGVTDLQGNEAHIDRYKDAVSDGYQLSGILGGTPSTPVLTAGIPDITGKLRLQRAKDMIWAYYFDSTIDEWIYLGETQISIDPLFIEISTFNRRSEQPVEVHFDNLKAEFVDAIELTGIPELILGLGIHPLGDFYIGSVEDITVAGDGGVYKVTPNGVITPFSSVADARALVFGASGDLFVGDSVNVAPGVHSKILRITPQEEVSVFVPAEDFPNTPRTITQIGIDAAGNLYAPSGDTANDADYVYRINSEGEVFIIAGGADFSGVATDSASNVYTGGTLDGVLYKIPPGGSLTSVSTGFSTPFQGAIAVTPDDSVYVLNRPTQELFWVDPVTGAKARIGKGSIALASDLQGSLYSLLRLQGVLHLVRVRPGNLN